MSETSPESTASTPLSQSMLLAVARVGLGIFALNIVRLIAALSGVAHYLGGGLIGWVAGFLVSAVIFKRRYVDALIVLSFLGAWQAWGWPWPLALALALAPSGLLLLLPSATLSSFRRR